MGRDATAVAAQRSLCSAAKAWLGHRVNLHLTELQRSARARGHSTLLHTGTQNYNEDFSKCFRLGLAMILVPHRSISPFHGVP
jgi:hypothetical protein